MPDIIESSPLMGTCGVCGKSLSPISGIPLPFPLPLDPATHKCEACGKNVCQKCFSRSRKKCVQCTSGRDGWCRTP